MRRLVAVIISIEIIMLTIIAIYHSVETPKRGMLHATTGYLNLSQWDFSETKSVSLDGEWEFYPGQLIEPGEEDDFPQEIIEHRQFVKVPSFWMSNPELFNSDKQIGTYRLHILLPQDGMYALRTPIIRNVSTVYMNGKQYVSEGLTEQEKPNVNAKIHFSMAESKNQKLEIVLHVKEAQYPIGSVLHSFSFGPVDHITELIDRQQVLDAALIVGYVILGFYYLGSFVQRRTAWYQLYFSLFCLLQGFYASLLNEQLFFILFPMMSEAMVTQLQLIIIQLSVLAFLQFIFRNFKTYAQRKIVNGLSVILGIQLFIYSIPAVSEWIMIELSTGYRFFIIPFIITLSHLYIVWILLKAFIDKTEESEYLLVITTTYTCYGLLLLLNFFYDIQIGYMQVSLFALLTISLSMLMGRRYHAIAIKAEKLANELIRNDQMKNEFFTRTGLEIQTPVASIIQSAQSLLEGLQGPLRMNQQQAVMEISTQGKQLMQMVEELLYIANTNHHSFTVNYRAVHPKVIEEVLEDMRFLLPSNYAVNITVSIRDSMPYLYVDEQLFKQIVYYLLHNAIQHTTAGEISITASLQDRHMYISISDTGMGIPKEEMESIFSPFYRIERSVPMATDGLGLGLPLAKQYVEALGGELTVKSQIGIGSTFTFSLPLATKEQQLEWQMNSQIHINDMTTMKEEVHISFPYYNEGEGRATILLVDDEPSQLKTLIEELQPLGYSLIAVDSGEEAITIVNQRSIDVMLVDLMMPDLSGYEVCKQIRKEYSLVDLPILILTAGVQSADFEMTMKAGANGFIRKPFQFELVKANVESALAIKQASKMAVHNELSHFHAQIAPHFLYNTLNTIIAMTYKDGKKAREALQHLATYFRAKLDFFRQDTLIPLEQELDLVESYIAIEEMRYGQRLTVKLEIDEEVEGWIPAMTIQPLVENAIRHGISKKDGGGTLFVSVQKQESGVEIIVEDNGVGISEQKLQKLLNEGEGIGFSNAFHKVKLLKNATMHVSSEEGKGTSITIFLPGVKVDESRTNR